MSEYLIPIDVVWMARLTDPFFWILTIVNIIIAVIVLYGAWTMFRERYPSKSKGGNKNGN